MKESTWFHAANGLFFTRHADGSVTITKTDGKLVAEGGRILCEQTLDAGSWVSAVLTMSAFGERPNDFFLWLKHHQGKQDMLLHTPESEVLHG